MPDFTYLPGSWWQMSDEIHGYWLSVSGQGRSIVQMLVLAERDGNGHKRDCAMRDADAQERAVLDPEVLAMWDADQFDTDSDDEFPVSLIRPYADRVGKEVEA